MTAVSGAEAGPLAGMSATEFKLWAGAIVVHWGAMLVLTHNVVARYWLALRNRGQVGRGEAACGKARMFHASMAIGIVGAVPITALYRPVYPEITWMVPVTTVAFVVAAIYATVRLGRWPGVSAGAIRRVSVPNLGLLGFDGGPWFARYPRRILDRYERRRAFRLGLPPLPEFKETAPPGDLPRRSGIPPI